LGFPAVGTASAADTGYYLYGALGQSKANPGIDRADTDAILTGAGAASLRSSVSNTDLARWAPLLGQYGAGTLPIALAAQSALAGQYTIEASATGYQTQSFSQDIPTADATHDFTLVP
jgi:hypothetical protein